MTISRRELLSLPLAGTLAAAQRRAEGASDDVLADKKHDPKTVEELFAAYSGLLKELKRLAATCYHLSQTSPPVGAIAAFAGTWPPKRLKDKNWTEAELGWLLCDGSKLDTVKYPKLAEILGTIYDPEKDAEKKVVKLPNLCGRGPIGAVVGRADRSLGYADGEEMHLLTIGEMPTHNHGVTDPGHEHDIHWGAAVGAGASSHERSGQDSVNPKPVMPNTYPATTGITIANTGDNRAHNNMSPFLVVNYCIKT